MSDDDSSTSAGRIPDMPELHERLAWARRHAKLKSPREAAKRFGWNENTYKSRENGLRGTPPDEVRMYARAFGVSYVWLATGEGSPINKGEPRIESDNSGLYEIATVPVRGETAAGRWLEFDAMEHERFPPIPAVPTKFKNAEQFAFRVSGPSMDKLRILDGDYVICVEYWIARAAIEPGDIVVVERHRGHVMERTCKQVEVKPNKFELWPRSNDPRFQTPIVIDRTDAMEESDGSRVEIVGLVVGRYSPL